MRISNNKEGDEGALHVAFFLSPLLGILAILFSNTHSRAIKATTLLATLSGLIASIVVGS